MTYTDWSLLAESVTFTLAVGFVVLAARAVQVIARWALAALRAGLVAPDGYGEPPTGWDLYQARREAERDRLNDSLTILNAEESWDRPVHPIAPGDDR